MVFGNVLAQSASLWVDNQCLLQKLNLGEFNINQLKSSNFYLEVGETEKSLLDEKENEKKKLLENVGNLNAISNFANAMIESGIHCTLKKRFAGHEDVAWHKFLPEACSYLNQSRVT
jgi:predicted alpha/beta superfamily hydrolase